MPPCCIPFLYVPYKLFRDFTQIDFTDLSFYDVLQQRQLAVRHVERRLEVVPPDTEVANHLKISAFEPVIIFLQWDIQIIGLLLNIPKATIRQRQAAF